MRHALLVTFAVCALAAPCFAAPDDTDRDSLQIVLKNGEKDGKPSGCFFSAKGSTQPLKDGTRLEVTLAARGRTRDFPVKILRAVVKDNAFNVSYPWPSRVFAPLLYKVTVELKVRKQARPIQQWLMNEYGYAHSHHEILDEKQFEFGSKEVRTTFALENIANIKGLVGDLEERRSELVAIAHKPSSEHEGWKGRYRQLNEGLIGFGNHLDRYFRQYVILLEQGFYQRLHKQMINLNRILRDYHRGRAGTQDRLAKLDRGLQATVELIKQYEPVPTEEPLVPLDDEEDEGRR